PESGEIEKAGTKVEMVHIKTVPYVKKRHESTVYLAGSGPPLPVKVYIGRIIVRGTPEYKHPGFQRQPPFPLSKTPRSTAHRGGQMKNSHLADCSNMKYLTVCPIP